MIFGQLPKHNYKNKYKNPLKTYLKEAKKRKENKCILSFLLLILF